MHTHTEHTRTRTHTHTHTHAHAHTHAHTHTHTHTFGIHTAYSIVIHTYHILALCLQFWYPTTKRSQCRTTYMHKCLYSGVPTI